MGMIKEFKEFIVKGNMVDLAVGLVIGGAFGACVKTLVEKVIMPPMGYLMGGIDFNARKWEIAPALAKGEEHPVYGNIVEKDIEAVAIGYGEFAGTIINLIIVGLAIFIVVKLINSMKRKAEEAPKEEAPPADIALLTEIRDALKAR